MYFMTKCTSTTFQNEWLQWIVLDTVYSLLKIKTYTTHCAKRYQMLVSFSWPFSGNEPSKIERKDHLWLCRIMPKSWWNLFTYSLFQKQVIVHEIFQFIYSMNSLYLSILIDSVQFSSVQSLSRVQLFETPWTAAHQASLSITNSWSFSIKLSQDRL